MKIQVEMNVRPWSAPNFVVCEVGGKENSVPLSEVGRDVVHALVVEWMTDVYKKAGIEPDWRFD
jgi:hypothetical protein